MIIRLFLSTVVVLIISFQMVSTASLYAWPDKTKTSFIVSANLKCDKGTEFIPIENGMDVHERQLQKAKINLELDRLSDASFFRTNLKGADIGETTFVHCSFRGADMCYVDAMDAEFIDCDFTDTNIWKIQYLRISASDLIKTKSYRGKNLQGCIIHVDTNGFDGVLDFSGFCLVDSDIRITGKNHNRVNFTGANIKNIQMRLSFEEIATTADYRNKCLDGVGFYKSDFENVDFSNFVFYECSFTLCHFKNANLSNSVLSGSVLDTAENLTLDQVKSTWNYKTGNMDGIVLPKEIQDQLDAESVVE